MEISRMGVCFKGYTAIAEVLANKGANVDHAKMQGTKSLIELLKNKE